jgi:ABC-type polysaccharide/polyol phosphate export permease
MGQREDQAKINYDANPMTSVNDQVRNIAAEALRQKRKRTARGWLIFFALVGLLLLFFMSGIAG